MNFSVPRENDRTSDRNGVCSGKPGERAMVEGDGFKSCK